METQLSYQDNVYTLVRYPKTEDNSLRAWSNAELLALAFIADKNADTIHLYNDRFGVWNCTLHHKNLTTIWTYASQQKAIVQNLRLNKLSTEVNFKTPLEDLDSIELALIKVPKSLELFELFLLQIHQSSTSKTEVVCCFMTKHFSASLLKIASKYFEEVTQTKAWKKARLLVLKQPKKIGKKEVLINTISWNKTVLQQHYGVFSSDKIDIGTQFFLEHLKINESDVNVLDLASGNGVIALEVANQNPNAIVTLVDDFNLAIASSKLNLQHTNAEFVCAENLDRLPENYFDLVVSNPPFHFEHENNIEVSLALFNDVQRVLKSNGRFVLVANKHLNYTIHLAKLFKKVTIIVPNKKFEVIACKK